MGQVFETIDTIKIIYLKQRYISHDKYIKNDIYNLDNNMVITKGDMTCDFSLFFFFKAREYFKSIKSINYKSNGNKEVIFVREQDKSGIKLEDIIKILNTHITDSFYSRAFVPCIPKYSKISLAKDAFKNFVFTYNLDNNILIDYPKMLSPYAKTKNKATSFEYVINDNLVNWIYENRSDLNTTKEEIEETYEKFKEDTINLINQ